MKHLFLETGKTVQMIPWWRNQSYFRADCGNNLVAKYPQADYHAQCSE